MTDQIAGALRDHAGGAVAQDVARSLRDNAVALRLLVAWQLRGRRLGPRVGGRCVMDRRRRCSQRRSRWRRMMHRRGMRRGLVMRKFWTVIVVPRRATPSLRLDMAIAPGGVRLASRQKKPTGRDGDDG